MWSEFPGAPEETAGQCSARQPRRAFRRARSSRPALRAGSNRLSKVLDLYWRLLELGDLGYTSRQLERRFDRALRAGGARGGGGGTVLCSTDTRRVGCMGLSPVFRYLAVLFLFSHTPCTAGSELPVPYSCSTDGKSCGRRLTSGFRL